MQNLDALPNDVYLTMKLYYYDDSKCVWPELDQNLGLQSENISICSPSPFKVTPAEYQPPGFKEGECDSLWFEGMAVHFKVGEVQTAFHNVKVRVSAEQGRLRKLQEGNHLRETKQVSQRNPPEGELIKVGLERGLLCKCGISVLDLFDCKQHGGLTLYLLANFSEIMLVLSLIQQSYFTDCAFSCQFIIISCKNLITGSL